MASLLRRLARVAVGTLAFALATLMIVVMPHFMVTLPGWQVVCAMILKILLGALLLVKGVEQYTLASFPGGSEGLEDPATSWMFAKLQELKQRSFLLWFLALLVLSFTPFLTMICLPLILARPFYVTAVTPGATPGMLLAELKRTARFLFHSAKGLFFLLLCTLAGSAVSLTIGLLYYFH